MRPSHLRYFVDSLEAAVFGIVHLVIRLTFTIILRLYVFLSFMIVFHSSVFKCLDLLVNETRAGFMMIRDASIHVGWRNFISATSIFQ